MFPTVNNSFPSLFRVMTNVDQSNRILSALMAFVSSETVSDADTVRRAIVTLRECFFGYVSDGIEFRESAFGGCGVFACSDIPRGTLVMVDKPCASVPDVILGGSEYANLDGSDSIALVMAIACDFNQSIENCVRGLYPVRCQGKTSSVDESFPCEVRQRLEQVLPEDVHPNDVIRAVQLNSLGFYTFPELCSYNDHLRFLSGTGLYSRASMFNHSCEPSVNHYSFGDVMLFRTTRDIKSGEELFISYIGSDLLCESTSVRQEFLGVRDFVCRCSKCSRPDDEEDIWVEELELSDRISIRMQPTPQSRSALIRRLLADRDFIRKDRIELEFQLCRELGTHALDDWNMLVDEVRATNDLSSLVVLVHFMATFGFDAALAQRALNIARICLGNSLGNSDLLAQVFRLTDFSSDDDRKRFDRVWSSVSVLH